MSSRTTATSSLAAARRVRCRAQMQATVRASVDELVYNQKQNEVIFIKYLN